MVTVPTLEKGIDARSTTACGTIPLITKPDGMVEPPITRTPPASNATPPLTVAPD
jgi:hypothetical protein